MKTQHTPGPWTTDGRFVSANEFRSGTPFVADAAISASMRKPGEVDANARLIAAAPDLLESLNDALDTLKHLGHDKPINEGGNPPLMAEIRAAISKATTA